MAKRINFTEEQKNHICNAYNAGVSQDFLTTVYGVSRRSIYRVLVERAVITPDNTRQIMALLKKHNIGYAYLRQLLED